jgi:MoaD family protein
MVRIKVSHYVLIDEHSGVKTEYIEVPKATVGDLIDQLAKKYGAKFRNLILNPKTGELQYGIIVSLNDQDVRKMKGLMTTLSDGDRVSLLPPISGG